MKSLHFPLLALVGLIGIINVNSETRLAYKYDCFSCHVVARISVTGAFTVYGNTQRLTLANVHHSGVAEYDFPHPIGSLFYLPSCQFSFIHLLYSCYVAYHVFEMCCKIAIILLF